MRRIGRQSGTVERGVCYRSQIHYFNENSVFYIFFLANETEAGRCLETARNVVRFAARESGKR